MAKQMTAKVTYKGVCNFCHGEFDKSQMTRHLKSCKERKAKIEAEVADAARSQKPRKTKLFEIVVEGMYLPMYWMYLELPALYTLYDLDDFLRAIWVECCGHLSAFEIGKFSYASQMTEDMGLGFSPVVGDEDEEANEEDDEEYEAEDEEDDEEFYGDDEVSEEEEDDGEPDLLDLDLENKSPAEMLEYLNKLLTDEMHTNVADLPPEEFKERFVQLIEERLRTEASATGTEVELPPDMRQQLEQMASALQMMFQFPLLANVFDSSERDMDVELREVLKVGDKFRYEYDFGSTTELRLRVVAEREGYFRKSEDSVRILARNIPPVIPCRECGQPATKIEPGYDSAWEGGLCDRCARKVGDVEWFLPVVNSPRAGVCGYTGED